MGKIKKLKVLYNIIRKLKNAHFFNNSFNKYIWRARGFSVCFRCYRYIAVKKIKPLF